MILNERPYWGSDDDDDDDDDDDELCCGIVDRRKAFVFMTSRNHCQRFWPLQISDTARAGFEPAQNLSSDLVEWSCAVFITTTVVCVKYSNMPRMFFWSEIYLQESPF